MATCDVNLVTNSLGIRQIGPRTVIVPADPIEWNGNTSYEYLTLVSSADFGQAYVSKKDVPAGTPLTDSNYWIPAAQFNAQLAQIQRDMASVKSDFNNISVFSTPEYFGAVGDGVTDDSVAFQNALDSGKPVFLSKKNYYINSTINVPNDAKIVGAQGSDEYLSESQNCIIIMGPNGKFTQKGQTNAHAVGFNMTDVYIKSSNVSPCIELVCTTYVRFYNVSVSGPSNVLMWEVYDSTFIGCSFGDVAAGNTGVELRSGNGGSAASPSYDSCNQITFIGCRFEGGAGCGIRFTTNTPINETFNNTIAFIGCHIESNAATARYVDASNVVNLTFDACSFVYNGSVLNDYFFYGTNLQGIYIRGCYVLSTSHTTAKEPFYVVPSGNFPSYIDLNVKNIPKTGNGTYSAYVGTYENVAYVNGFIRTGLYNNISDYQFDPSSHKQINPVDNSFSVEDDTLVSFVFNRSETSQEKTYNVSVKIDPSTTKMNINPYFPSNEGWFSTPYYYIPADSTLTVTCPPELTYTVTSIKKSHNGGKF